MNRRRTAVVALAISVVGALSACSATAHPGAAAVVGDQRITVSALQAHVAAYRTAAAKDAGAQEAAGEAQKTLGLLVAAQLVDQALAAQGGTVTQGEVQQAEASYLQQAGSAQALRQAIVENLALAPSDLDTYARFEVGRMKLLQHAGVDPTSTSADAAFQKIIQKAGQDLGVTVNPRYGSWDAKTLSLGAPNQPWLKTTKAATTSPAS